MLHNTAAKATVGLFPILDFAIECFVILFSLGFSVDGFFILFTFFFIFAISELHPSVKN